MLLKEKYKQELFWIKKALENCWFEDADNSESFEDDVVYPFEQAYHEGEFNWDSGATKGVLIFEKLGFVVKIPFKNCDGEPLNGADDAIEKWNYCEQEEKRYEKYEKEGFGNVFLKTEFIDFINEHPIYIQEFAEPICTISEEDRESHSSHTKVEKDLVYDLDDKEIFCRWMNDDWRADILTIYGLKFYCELMSSIYENKFRDLTGNNIGYIGKRPVIIDYAEFND